VSIATPGSVGEESRQPPSLDLIMAMWVVFAEVLFDKAYGRVMSATTTVYLGYGERTPLVLRAERNDTYMLLRDAYVHGMMHREVMGTSPPIKEFTLV
jgi:hypothetical protein